MSKLVDCPKCGGTGQIKVPVNQTTPKSKNVIDFKDNDLVDFTVNITPPDKPKPYIYKSCPDCNGLGWIRG